MQHDVAVRDHRALGLAGRARGVDEDREVLGLARGRCAAPTRRGCVASYSRAERAQLRRGSSPAGRRARAGLPCRTRRSCAAAAGARAPPAPCRAARRPRRTAIDRARVGEQVLDLRRRRRSDRCRSPRRRRRARRGPRTAIRGWCWRGSRPPRRARSRARRGPCRPRARRGRARPRSRPARCRTPSGAGWSAGRASCTPCQNICGTCRSCAHLHCFFFFQRRCPRTPASFMPR